MPSVLLLICKLSVVAGHHILVIQKFNANLNVYEALNVTINKLVSLTIAKILVQELVERMLFVKLSTTVPYALVFLASLVMHTSGA